MFFTVRLYRTGFIVEKRHSWVDLLGEGKVVPISTVRKNRDTEFGRYKIASAILENLT